VLANDRLDQIYQPIACFRFTTTIVVMANRSRIDKRNAKSSEKTKKRLPFYETKWTPLETHQTPLDITRHERGEILLDTIAY